MSLYVRARRVYITTRPLFGVTGGVRSDERRDRDPYIVRGGWSGPGVPRVGPSCYVPSPGEGVEYEEQEYDYSSLLRERLAGRDEWQQRRNYSG